ncbi:hypothetical protein N9064_00570 [bacterium]|nr:hypothetical protein [bacterium]
MNEVKITKEEYARLLKVDRKMDCLEAGGVDDWEWYGVSLEKFYQEEEREENIAKLCEEIMEIICGEVDEPAGCGCGYGITEAGQDQVQSLLEGSLKRYNLKLTYEEEA